VTRNEEGDRRNEREVLDDECVTVISRVSGVGLLLSRPDNTHCLLLSRLSRLLGGVEVELREGMEALSLDCRVGGRVGHTGQCGSARGGLAVLIVGVSEVHATGTSSRTRRLRGGAS